LAAAYALDQVCFPPNIAYSRAELRAFVARPDAYAIVAEAAPDPAADTAEAGVLAGFLVATHRPRRRDGTAHIITLDIDPAFRRRGVAATLMEEAEKHYIGLEQGCMDLEVAVDNDAAQRFYLKIGFLPLRRLRGYYGRGLDAIAMRKVF
jgi:ribosomal-protein-alanine N-acetyltransferase